MLSRLHIVISSEKEVDYLEVKDKLLKINPDFSPSPMRPYNLLKDHSEFYLTLDLHQSDVKELLEKLNNDWDGEIDDCSCYGFNTKMFDPRVYCLEFTLFD